MFRNLSVGQHFGRIVLVHNGVVVGSAGFVRSSIVLFAQIAEAQVVFFVSIVNASLARRGVCIARGRTIRSESNHRQAQNHQYRQNQSKYFFHGSISSKIIFSIRPALPKQLSLTW